MRAEIDARKFISVAVRLSLLAASALFASFLICFAARAFVIGRTMERQREVANIVAGRQPGIFHTQNQNEASQGMTFTSFGVSDSNPAETSRAAVSPVPSANIRDFRLVGTLPSVGAWIEFKDEVSLMLKGNERDGYTLEEIAPEYAVLTRGGGKFTLYLTYWSPAGARASNVPRQRRAQREPIPAPPSEPAAPSPENSGVVIAEANGEDGTISRELLNELLVNPLAEVGKMRLVPTDDGMMIAGMRSDSL
ncbi:MAG: hypothetical protein LBK91_03205, partial [Synergistaceae bacterium]|nr:hypothetical protein [Synergistaceae bacterium]